MIRNKIENTPITNIRKEEDVTTDVTLTIFLKNMRNNDKCV